MRDGGCSPRYGICEGIAGPAATPSGRPARAPRPARPRSNSRIIKNTIYFCLVSRQRVNLFMAASPLLIAADSFLAHSVLIILLLQQRWGRVAKVTPPKNLGIKKLDIE